MMQRIEPALFASKFRGTLLGVLVGDCCGLPFEFEGPTNASSAAVIKNNLDKLEGEYFKAPVKSYSDDTAMTKALVSTLLARYTQKELAKNFTKEFFKAPNRGYGRGVITVFEKLKGSKFVDPTGPAKEQFFGNGSYGNGGAMRVAPIALYCWNNLEEMTRMVRETTEITHTHRLGINGALLQAFAVQQALVLDPTKDKINATDFIDNLIEKIEPHEKPDDDDIDARGNEYKVQLEAMKQLLTKDSEPTKSEVVTKLGNTISAQHSVPTAIYCFLRSEKEEVKNSSSQHPFRNTLEYAITLGGDTDTIASMACAITGAYYGDEVIPRNLLRHCEDSENVATMGDQLWKMVVRE